jgi:redox-sensitive bicupin YhaK (pirin superfamily)
MIDIIPSNHRYFSDFGWLRTYWLFSFASYFDPQNIQFGALRVFNDDIVEPKTGFPTHPHQEMEIITVVLDGEMTHEDSMGNKAIIRKGDVQRMSAGTGLTHSEFNLAEEPVHFYQIWLLPDTPELAPSYDQKTFPVSEWQNTLLPIASGQGLDNVVTFNTDATIYRCELHAGHKLSFDNTTGRRIFIYLKEGDLMVDGQRLKNGDQARIDTESRISIQAHEATDFILIDVPSCKGWGYSEKILQGEQK